MDMGLFKQIYEFAPALGIAVAIVVILLGVIGKAFGFTGIADKSKLVDEAKITQLTSGVAAIGTKLDGIDHRLTSVEKDVAARATADEVHRMELAFTRMEGRIGTMETTGAATKEAVTRIENFMYEAALRARNGG